MTSPSTRAVLRAFALLLLIASVALPVSAFQAVDQQSVEIPLSTGDALLKTDYATAMASRAVERELQARHGSGWRVQLWNRLSGTAHLAYGPSIVTGVTPRSGAELESLARGVMADHREIFPGDQSALRMTAAPHALGKWVAHFQQTWQGLDVWQAGARLGFADDGRVMFMASDLYTDIALDPTPSIDASTAFELARAGLAGGGTLDSSEGEPTLLVLPVPREAGGADLHLVWRVRVASEEPFGTWVTHVDAHDGTIVWRYNDVHFAYGGDTDSGVSPITWCEPIEQQTMPYLSIDVSGLGSVTSDANGDWSMAGTGGNRTVSCDLQGPYIHVANNYAGAEAFFSGTAAEDTPLTVRFDDLNSQLDERTVFDGINDIHDFFQLVAPEFGYTNGLINGYVSRVDNICPGNAWWNGSINFCAASGTYANTGQIAGVVHHEYGHGIQANILGWQGDQGLGEGNGDIIANFITDEAIIGRGFFTGNCVSGIRNSDNNLVYPGDVLGAEIHDAGRVIAGFHWDANMALQDAYGVEAGRIRAAKTWHYGRTLTHPTTQPDQVFGTFFADDDDGDLSNGTPDYYAYCGAAVHHGFDCPDIVTGITISHTPLSDGDDTVNPIAVVAVVTTTGAELPTDGVQVHWRANSGAWQTTTLTGGGVGGSTYTGAIPPQQVGSVDYYLTATDIDGLTETVPNGGYAAPYNFLVAWSLDDAEADTGWTTEVSNGADPAGGWVRVDPVGTIAQPEDDHTVDGTLCWITGQHTPGDPVNADDVDGGWVTLTSPSYNVAGASTVIMRYWKWFSNDLNGSSGADLWKAQASTNGLNWYNMEQVQDSSNGWEAVTVDILNMFTDPQQLNVRFQAFDLSAEDLVEAGVDDVTLVAIWGTTGVDDGFVVSVPMQLEQNVPNPFNPVTEIKFSLAQAGEASLAIFDAQGRRVRTLLSGQQSAGAHTLQWNGRDDAGNGVASGVYFYRLHTDAGVQSKRMLLIK